MWRALLGSFPATCTLSFIAGTSVARPLGQLSGHMYPLIYSGNECGAPSWAAFRPHVPSHLQRERVRRALLGSFPATCTLSFIAGTSAALPLEQKSNSSKPSRIPKPFTRRAPQVSNLQRRLVLTAKPAGLSQCLPKSLVCSLASPPAAKTSPRYINGPGPVKTTSLCAFMACKIR